MLLNSKLLNSKIPCLNASNAIGFKANVVNSVSLITLKLLASLRSSLRDGPSLRYGALHSSLSLLAILAWGIKLILISIANKATETCPEANISVEKREINIKKNSNQA